MSEHKPRMQVKNMLTGLRSLTKSDDHNKMQNQSQISEEELEKNSNCRPCGIRVKTDTAHRQLKAHRPKLQGWQKLGEYKATFLK